VSIEQSLRREADLHCVSGSIDFALDDRRQG